MGTRKALVVGINYYQHGSNLYGCVDDARAVEAALSRHEDQTRNFGTHCMLAPDEHHAITRSELKDNVVKLFQDRCEIALFYFAGHGYVEQTGGFLMCSEAREADDGFSLNNLLELANDSPAENKVILLDSCHSGILGQYTKKDTTASLAEGLTVLTASTQDQYATERNGRGVFSTLLVDALNGSAANLTGSVTPGSIYAHIDQSLGEWEQRPVFKTNVQRFVSLRTVNAPIALAELQRIATLFPEEGLCYPLDPTYEPELRGRAPGMPAPDPVHTEIFAVLQKYNRLNLLVPVEAPHMWHAAMESKSCKLTALGEHYRRLVAKGMI
ncbi:MAG: caspase family protein [Pseudomonadota bacterium]